MSKSLQQLPPLDERQRYTIPEANRYLRQSNAYTYRQIARGELRSITDGRRRYIPGAELIRKSTLP